MSGVINWIGIFWLASSTLMVLWMVLHKLKKDPDLPIWGFLVPVIVLAPLVVVLALVALIMNEFEVKGVWPNEH